MKAFLLSAGLGSRLRPLTLTIPKCLVPLGNYVLLEIWLKFFERYYISETLINLHYLPEEVKNFVNNYHSNLKISTCYEPVLRGSLGTILENNRFYEGEQNILVAYSDNLTNLNLSDFIHFHLSHSRPITMGVFNADNPKECGIVEVDETNLVVDFKEKPKRPKSSLANAGIYLFKTELLNSLTYRKEDFPLDIGYDLLPKFINNIMAYKINGYFIDIGNIQRYEEANSFFVKNEGLFV